MSVVDAIGSRGWTMNAGSVGNTDKESDTKDSFSAILQDLKSGGSGAGANGGSDEEETSTITQVLSDGSVLVTVYQGNEIISQTKTRSANPEENPQVVSTSYEGNITNDAASVQGITASGAAASSMLNALMQN